MLWRNEMFWGKRAPNAESSFIILTHYGLIYLWRSYESVVLSVISLLGAQTRGHSHPHITVMVDWA